ncbi:MarR family winged helix-turn-helix transcriptional regulator [Oceanicaulis sp.]|uniref:MarR family winged helix-turn-helix transcriptional regulator n=1 Tax=Oceanicaulis sp. TaxID=1924941 RepID=UPI003F722064
MTDSPDLERALKALDRTAFIGRRSEALSDLIQDQSQAVFDLAGITIPVKSCSLMIAIKAMGPASITDLAEALSRSHQVLLQKTPRLIKLGLIESRPDPDNRRRKLFEATAHGAEQLERLQEILPRIEAAYEDLVSETGEIAGVLKAALTALEKTDLKTRMGL